MIDWEDEEIDQANEGDYVNGPNTGFPGNAQIIQPGGARAFARYFREGGQGKVKLPKGPRSGSLDKMMPQGKTR